MRISHKIQINRPVEAIFKRFIVKEILNLRQSMQSRRRTAVANTNSNFSSRTEIFQTVRFGAAPLRWPSRLAFTFLQQYKALIKRKVMRTWSFKQQLAQFCLRVKMANFLLGKLQTKLALLDENETLEIKQPLSLQLYSEYRSTYKWHEFSANSSGAHNSSASASNVASNNEVVVRKPPKPVTGKTKRKSWCV